MLVYPTAIHAFQSARCSRKRGSNDRVMARILRLRGGNTTAWC